MAAGDSLSGGEEMETTCLTAGVLFTGESDFLLSALLSDSGVAAFTTTSLVSSLAAASTTTSLTAVVSLEVFCRFDHLSWRRGTAVEVLGVGCLSSLAFTSFVGDLLTGRGTASEVLGVGRLSSLASTTLVGDLDLFFPALTASVCTEGVLALFLGEVLLGLDSASGVSSRVVFPGLPFLTLLRKAACFSDNFSSLLG